ACAAICATFDAFKAQNVVANCRKMAPVMLRGLQRLKSRFPFIKFIRGEGLVYGVEISNDDTANKCVLEAYYGVNGEGVHLLGPLAGKVLRVSPPLVITGREINQAIAILEKAWERV
ncbi:MAG: aminotransferase class III-fold pyridoxal phosphate-dependent enzyme, partial [Candidatus Hydrogenedentes bacterium]|nr:aminotransferase class III-fold pyridoxal phosphate-dependent enzyme [Candidatus Hydrogenedentota bacterium]